MLNKIILIVTASFMLACGSASDQRSSVFSSSSGETRSTIFHTWAIPEELGFGHVEGGHLVHDVVNNQLAVIVLDGLVPFIFRAPITTDDSGTCLRFLSGRGEVPGPLGAVYVYINVIEFIGVDPGCGRGDDWPTRASLSIQRFDDSFYTMKFEGSSFSNSK